jgi:hypothetical protein
MGEILHVATFDTICGFKFATNCVEHNLQHPWDYGPPFFRFTYV